MGVDKCRTRLDMRRTGCDGIMTKIDGNLSPVGVSMTGIDGNQRPVVVNVTQFDRILTHYGMRADPFYDELSGIDISVTGPDYNKTVTD